MRRTSLSVLLLALAIPATAAEPEKPIGFPSALSTADWPWWRGPWRNGVVPQGDVPLEWSETEHVVWKARVPGRGHSSPTVVGDRVFLATADEEQPVQSVLCYDRDTGEKLWQTEVHRGGFDKGGNKRSSQASSTVACDGERLFVNFLNSGAVHTTALALDGERLWQTKVSDFVNHQGFGSSPAIYENLVLVTADNKGGGAFAALDQQTGEIAYRIERPKKANYTSPILLDVGGRHQAILAGCDLVAGFDPRTGGKLWETEGATTECVTSVVASGGLVFTSGGYPRNHLQAVHADGSTKTAWQNNTRVYVPSFVAHEGHLYVVTDAGIAQCYEAATGKVLWQERLGGKFNASLVLAGERIYAAAEDGRTVVFRASPESYQLLAENRLGNEVFATPAFSRGRIYHRVAVRDGKDRQEWLYCLGE